MTLSDGDIAALARQAADTLAPSIDVQISPEGPFDAYRAGFRAWLIDLKGVVTAYVSPSATPAEALAHLLDQISEYGGESDRFWGDAFPPCPGHPHPATVSVDGDDVVLTCPDTGREVGRLHPAVTP